MKRATPRQGSAAEGGVPERLWSLQIGKNRQSAKAFRTACALRAGGGGSECAMRREHRRPLTL